MTIIEVIVAIGIFSIMMIGVSVLIANSFKYQRFILNTNSISIKSNQTITKIIDNIRRATQADNGGYAISSMDDFEFSFFVDIDKDGDTEKVRYYLSGNDLMVGTIDPVGNPITYPSENEVIDTVVSGVINESSEPLFYYYDGTNSVLTTPVVNLISSRMVKVRIIFEGEGDSVDTEMESFASMRNLSDYDGIE